MLLLNIYIKYLILDDDDDYFIVKFKMKIKQSKKNK